MVRLTTTPQSALDPPAHRSGSAVIVVTDAEGRVVPHAQVIARQTGHGFSFGNIGFDFDDLAAGRGATSDRDLASLWPSTAEGEARQADELARHYRTLFGHPAVESITYWGITDRGAWLGAPIGLVRADGTRKPAYDALHGLIRGEWWMKPTALTADADGRVVVTGTRGTYAVQAGQTSVEVQVGATGDQPVELRIH